MNNKKANVEELLRYLLWIVVFALLVLGIYGLVKKMYGLA